MAEIRFTKDGVPIFDGSAESFVPYKRAALNYVETLEWKKRSLAGPRLQTALEGPARVAVQHQRPGWISHEKGADQLLDFLREHVQAPTLSEAGKNISRFFYQVRRRRGESMNSWIVRHDESLFEARRTLAEAIHEYGGYSGRKALTTRSSPSKAPSGPRSKTPSLRSAQPFDENGLMQDTDDEGQQEQNDTAWTDNWWNQQSWWSRWDDNKYNHWSTRSSGDDDRQGDWSAKYDVSERASEEADRFLPDFVVAWMLLQRSGLDGGEKAAIIANLKNDFTTSKVKEALKLNWTEEDLKKRDQSRSSALLLEDEDENLLQAEEELNEPPEWMDSEQQEEYNHLTSEVESAMAAIQGARRTLREAREKQTLMRKSRSFYPVKKESSFRAKSDQPRQCFRCGSTDHLSAQCPQKEDRNAKDGQAVHFTFALSTPEPDAATGTGSNQVLAEGTLLSMNAILDAGKAIIDGGATSTVGSTDAMERIAEINVNRGADHRCEVSLDEKPSFRFGNNGRKTCLSTAHLPVPLGGAVGQMKVHVHDVPGQPVLLSIAALRSLGAVIDFSKDQMILTKVSPDRVINLERTGGGHQVFPLTSDIFENSLRRQSPFVSLVDDHTE